jgi:hypothetical protein
MVIKELEKSRFDRRAARLMADDTQIM